MTDQEIYSFMNGRDVSTSFSDSSHNSEINFIDFVGVDREAKRVKSELASKKDGTFLLEAAFPAITTTNEETGEITILTPAVPAVYYEYTNDAALIASITSDLDVEALLGEI